MLHYAPAEIHICMTIQALKALALVRSQKVEESLVVCDEVLAAKPTDESTLAAMMHVLRGLGRRELWYDVWLHSQTDSEGRHGHGSYV